MWRWSSSSLSLTFLSACVPGWHVQAPAGTTSVLKLNTPEGGLTDSSVNVTLHRILEQTTRLSHRCSQGLSNFLFYISRLFHTGRAVKLKASHSTESCMAKKAPAIIHPELRILNDSSTVTQRFLIQPSNFMNPAQTLIYPRNYSVSTSFSF